MPAVLRNLEINRVAAVDRGAGEGVKIVLWKRGEGSVCKECGLAGTHKSDCSRAGSAEKSFDNHDLAVLLHKSYAAIEKAAAAEDARATMLRALGKAIDAVDASVHSIAADSAISDVGAEAMIGESLKAFEAHVAKLGLPADAAAAITADVVAAHPLLKGETDMTPAEVQKMIDDAVGKATKPLTDTIGKQQDIIALMGLTPAQKAYHDQLPTDEAKKAFRAKPDTEKDDDMEKRPHRKGIDALDGALREVLGPVLETNKALTAQVDKLTKGALAASEAATIEAYAKRAEDIGLPRAHGEVMRKAAGGDADAIKKHDELVKGLLTQVRTGKVFAEFGKQSTGGEGASSYDRLNEMAKALVDTVAKTAGGKPLTFAQAFTKVFTDPANAELAAAHKAEEMQARRRVA